MPDTRKIRADAGGAARWSTVAAALLLCSNLQAQLRPMAVCDAAHTAANSRYPTVPASDGWFDVRAVEPGVFALVEARQFQEVISWLIVGRDRALLFDTGLGMRPIRPIVSRLTTLPVTVINSHTHFDHSGGNFEFSDVRAMRGPYTERNKRGKTHTDLASEVTTTALCGNVVPGLDTAAFRLHPWQSSAPVKDGERFALGGRTIEVVSVPGHTPDALALLDRQAGLLWTGDTFYAGPIWLFMQETNLADYGRSIDRLAALLPQVKRVLPAHNVAVVDPAVLLRAQRAFHEILSGRAKGSEASQGAVTFPFDGFSFLISSRALATLASRRAPR